MTNQTKIIRLASATPLPCCIYNPATNDLCRKPAYAAYAYPSEATPRGQWLIQPVCRECAEKARKVYASDNH